jgi:ABC-type phosphate transport system substrate-binding protein
MTKRLLFQLLAAFAASISLASGAEDIVAVVSSKSPIVALNSEQVADIFLGKTTRFPDGSAAIPIDQNEDSPDRDRFYAQYTGKSPAQVKAHWSKLIFTGRGQPPKQVANGAEAKRAVAQDPHAIAYIDNRLVDSSVRVLAGQ